MKTIVTLSAALAALFAAGNIALADDDDHGGYGVRGGDDGGYAAMAQAGNGFKPWIRGEDSEDGEDDDGAAGAAPQPSTPPANGLFGNGVPQVQTN